MTGRVVLAVGAGIGSGVPLGMFGTCARLAMPHCPRGGTFLAMAMYPLSPHVVPQLFFTIHVVAVYLRRPMVA